MLAKRIIPCLDIKEGRVVKGTNFVSLRDAGDPGELAQRYVDDGADELVFLDITASKENRDTLKNLVRSVAEKLDIPFTVGGGIRKVEDVKLILRNGADKTSLNTAAVEDPKIIEEAAKIFGRQCVVLAVDVKRIYEDASDKTTLETPQGRCWFRVYTYGGTVPTNLDAIEWIKRGTKLGAGEILLTSMDRDGTGEGYDNVLNRLASESVDVPVIASGGAGSPKDFFDAFKEGKVDAALAASVFHYSRYPVSVVKRYLKERGVEVRI